jgi:hypothetical protein
LIVAIPFSPGLTLQAVRSDAGTQANVSIRLFTFDEARDELFSLRYRAYRNAGLIGENPDGTYSDCFDDQPSTLLIGVYADGTCAGTCRLSFAGGGSETGSLPSEGTYPEARAIRAKSNGLLVECSRLAIDPDISNNSFRTTLYAVLVRTAILAAMAASADVAFVTAQMKWRKFYEYVCAFNAISEPRLHPLGDVPVVLFAREIGDAGAKRGRRNPFLHIRPDEIAALRARLTPVMAAMKIELEQFEMS